MKSLFTSQRQNAHDDFKWTIVHTVDSMTMVYEKRQRITGFFFSIALWPQPPLQ